MDGQRVRVTAALLAAVWIPFMSVRCVPGPGGGSGCLAFAGRTAADAGDHHAGAPHAHQVPGKRAAEHAAPGGSPRHPSGKHTCCELTGKCNILRAAEISTLGSLEAAPVLIPARLLLPERLGVDLARLTAQRSHAPPSYLRHQALLL
jgi:hypothetical protein